jgi:glycosyltransferase involved in cell wall biosynthesis
MHKVLVRTELARLRELGYEVFNPPYLSSLPDQSAELNWDGNQTSSLPKDVFDKLSKFNFFYNHISTEMSEILNKYFDAVIVTIHTDWLREILKVYHGKTIFRTYGQISTNSELLTKNRSFELIVKHPDFYFAPHSEEALTSEQSWLTERSVVIPYCLTSDIFQHKDTFDLTSPKNGTVAVSCPNIQDEYYGLHYKFLKEHLPAEKYLIYGVQLSSTKDTQVVGTIPRASLIERFRTSNVYLYTYDYPHVCFLPPIEMMILGGPVVFLKGSLLDKYFHQDPAPGRAQDINDAKKLCDRILAGDIELANAIIESQKKIRERYDPQFVWPEFDRKMTAILSSAPALHQSALMSLEPGSSEKSDKTTVFLFHHFPGECINFKGGQYSAHDGIPRVMRHIVDALLKSGKFSVRVTARRDQAPQFYGFFKSEKFQDLQIFSLEDLVSKKMRLFVLLNKVYRFSRRWGAGVDAPVLNSPPPALSSSTFPTSKSAALTPQFPKLDRLLKFLIDANHFFILQSLVFFAVGLRPFAKLLKTPHSYPRTLHGFLAQYFLHFGKTLRAFENRLGPLLAVKMINESYASSLSLIPHYHLFPECLSLKGKTLMYLPDFTPHFFEETGEFGSHIQETAIGQHLVKNAKVVFTNSLYSKSYLPNTRLQVPADKIQVFYLPNLNTENSELSFEEAAFLHQAIGDSSYIFYPTQPRQNKKIDLLLRVFDSIADKRPNLRLVLTSHFVPHSVFDIEFSKMVHKDRVLFLPQVSDAALSWLYKNASVLALTSTMEGNFPPQIFEALFHRVPIVATGLPLIFERLEGLQDHLILCTPQSESEFHSGLLRCLDKRHEVLQRQEKVRDLILTQGAKKTFDQEVLKLMSIAEGR